MKQKASDGNNLAHLFPEVANQWHPTKNGSLEPKHVTPKSNKKVWWQCPCGDDHEWERIIGDHVSSQNCPFCAGRVPSKSNNFATKYPNAALLWHQDKNGAKPPSSYLPYSNAVVWWKCPHGEDHEWEGAISEVARGQKCPFCERSRPSAGYNLATQFPKIASEWHPVRNNGLKATDFLPRSSQKVWWKCPHNEEHEWQALIKTRTSRGSNCEFCSGRKASSTNNLAFLYPDLCKEWHPIKNGTLRPTNFTRASSKKIWWQCPKNNSHEWQSVISDRTSGHGCPSCKGSTSKSEIRLLTEIKAIFPSTDILWRKKIEGMEIDIYIPEFKVGIEYDGAYWHKKKTKDDLYKSTALEQRCGILVFRVRQWPLELLSQRDVSSKTSDIRKGDLNNLLTKISKFTTNIPYSLVENYMIDVEWKAEKEYQRYLSYLPAPPPEFSIKKSHPEHCLMWHPRNYPLNPENFTSGSKSKVWWLCKKNPKHEFQRSIQQKIYAKADYCPFCYKSLSSEYPAVSLEWHSEKNGELTPDEVNCKSVKKVWWQCPHGEDHEWQASIANRTFHGSKCPFCVGRKISITNCLRTNYPKISEEWHPQKNGDLTPDEVTFHSVRRVWWLCSSDCHHEWVSTVRDRVNGKRCPKCIE